MPQPTSWLNPKNLRSLLRMGLFLLALFLGTARANNRAACVQFETELNGLVTSPVQALRLRAEAPNLDPYIAIGHRLQAAVFEGAQTEFQKPSGERALGLLSFVRRIFSAARGHWLTDPVATLLEFPIVEPVAYSDILDTLVWRAGGIGSVLNHATAVAPTVVVVVPGVMPDRQLALATVAGAFEVGVPETSEIADAVETDGAGFSEHDILHLGAEREKFGHNAIFLPDFSGFDFDSLRRYFNRSLREQYRLAAIIAGLSSWNARHHRIHSQRDEFLADRLLLNGVREEPYSLRGTIPFLSRAFSPATRNKANEHAEAWVYATRGQLQEEIALLLRGDDSPLVREARSALLFTLYGNKIPNHPERLPAGITAQLQTYAQLFIRLAWANERRIDGWDDRIPHF